MKFLKPIFFLLMLSFSLFANLQKIVVHRYYWDKDYLDYKIDTLGSYPVAYSTTRDFPDGTLWVIPRSRIVYSTNVSDTTSETTEVLKFHQQIENTFVDYQAFRLHWEFLRQQEPYTPSAAERFIFKSLPETTGKNPLYLQRFFFFPKQPFQWNN